MFKKLLLTFFLLFSSFITIYPTKKENIKLFDYCYSLEKRLSKNSVKSINLPKDYKTLAKNITLFGTDKTKGELVNKIIDQYKSSKNSFMINLLPNKFYCLAGYWIERVNPGTFQSIFYERGKEGINQYKNIKKEVDELIKNINESKDIKMEVDKLINDISESKDIKKEVDEFIEEINTEYKFIKKGIDDLF